MRRERAAHEQHLGLARAHLVDELVEPGQRQRGSVRAHAHGLTVRAEPVDPVEAVGVGGAVAGHEGLVEERLHGSRLQLEHGRLEVLDVGARLLEEVIDVGVAPEDLEGGRLLGERGRVLVPLVADAVEARAGRGVLAVVGEAVARDLDEGQPLQDGALLGHRLDDPGEQGVVAELCRVGERQRHGFAPPGVVWRSPSGRSPPPPRAACH